MRPINNPFNDLCLYRIFRICTVLVVLTLCLLLPATARAWPTDGQWTSVAQQSNWSPIRDITGDMSPYNADISSNGFYKDLTVGTWNSVSIYSDGSFVYFRFLLSGNPLSYNTPLSTWQIDSRTSYLALIDRNGDNITDFTVTVSKDNSLKVFQGAATIQSIPFGPITQSGSVYTESGGYLRVIDTGTILYDRPGTPSAFNLHYLDYRIPISWLPGITPKTFIRPYYGTSNNDNNINKDYMIGNSLNFDNVGSTTIGGIGTWGALYDTRDTAPSSNGGIWYGKETLLVTGFGWPSSRTLTVQIYSPDGTTLLWQGTVQTNAKGEVLPTATWPIPLTVGPGFYRINVINPTSGASLLYDTFEIRAPFIKVTKTVTPGVVNPGSEVTYTITLQNTGNIAAAMTTITDTMQNNFIYKPGTTTGLTTANPAIINQALTWTGTWTIPVGGTLTLSFKATTAFLPAIYYNAATAAGTNFGPYSSGPTAPVQVAAPAMQLSKEVDKAKAGPGETVTYTIYFKNIGNGSAQSVFIFDTVPFNTTYKLNSLRIGNGGSTYATATPRTDGPGENVVFIGEAEISGSNIIFTISTLAADDGVPNGGNDEGKAYFQIIIN